MLVKFRNSVNTDFYNTLRSRVEDYFTSNNLSKHADARMVWKTIFILSVFGLSYAAILSGTLSFGWSMVLWVVLGFFSALIGFNISHDAVHHSYSANPLVNRLLGYTFDMLGASSYMWNISHNVIHHTFTNIPEHDDDLEPVFFIRLNPEKRIYKIHRYQHWYATFFYGLTSLSWVFMKDYAKMFQKRILQYPVKRIPFGRVLEIFTSKILYYFMFIALPMLITGYSPLQVALGFLAMHFVEGITLAIVFQLAHVVENTTFPIPDADGNVENNWAIHQLCTTANFSRNSKLAKFLTGGLNYQVEHHLFPKVCHIHYDKLSEIVRQSAEEFGIPYHANNTFPQAIRSHYRMLKVLGRTS